MKRKPPHSAFFNPRVLIGTVFLAILLLGLFAFDLFPGGSARAQEPSQNGGPDSSGPACTPGALQAWTLAANYPTLIESPAVGSDGTFVYSAGGFNGSGPTNAFYRYNPATNSWTTLPPMPAALYAVRGTYAANTNCFYVFGGFDGSIPVRTTYIYNLGTNTWSTGAPIPDMLKGRSFVNVAYYPVNGKIYVIGGFYSADFTGEANETYRYDPLANTWASLGSMPFPMAGSATSISGQYIYLAGSWGNPFGGSGSTLHYRYNIEANTWAAMAAVPVVMYNGTGGAIGGKTYLVGGGNPSRPQGQGTGFPGLASGSSPDASYNTTYIYDIASNSWSSGPNTNTFHSFPGGTTIGARLMVVGGYNGLDDTNTVEITSTTCASCNGDYRALIVFSDSSVQPTTLRNSLLAEPGITAVDLFNGQTATPTLAQLQQYDIVISMSNTSWADQTTLGNNLGSYLTGAGVVVALNFDWFGSTQSILGTWSTANTPFNNPATGNSFSNATLGTCTFAPLCSGVNTLNAFYRQTLTLASGATLAATWNDGPPLMAYKGRAVAINAYLGDSPLNSSGQYARVIANAARWLNPGTYVYSTSTGSIVAGTTDTGNHTDDGSTVIALPFSYQLYDQTFSNVSVGSNGHLTFGTINDGFNPTCVPIAGATYAIGPYWTDQCTGPCTGVTGNTYGIFTSISGASPNRIFNIEWRTAYYNSGGAGIPLNYEVRLYEGQTAFDVIYGTVPATFTPPNPRNLSVGVQQSSTTQFTLKGCDNTGGGSPPAASGQLYHYTLSPFTCSPAAVSISGTVIYCSNPVPGPVANVTLSLTGAMSSSTLSDGSGNYTLSSLPSGGNYVVTPTKAAHLPGSAGINTVDVIAVQRHFLNVGTPLSGCRLTAADVNGVSGVNTVDVIAVQRFFLGLSTGIANTGKYQFSPANITYPGISGNQTGQNYNALVFGDVATPFAPRAGGASEDVAGDDGVSVDEVAPTVAEVSLPEVALGPSKSNFIAAVTTTAIDATTKLVGFQGDFTFDERVVTFADEPVQKAGLTDGNWNVSGNVLSGAGPVRTLRISAYSLDFTPLSGSGTLFELRMRAVSDSALRLPHSAFPLVWKNPPDGFTFIDADLNTQKPINAVSGSVAPSGKRK